MATKKITVTLPIEQLEAIRDLVKQGQVKSVSGFLQHAVRISLDDVAGWRRALTEALDETGGPPTRKERAWVNEVLFGKRKKRRKAA
jgi:Arc/MetJ-type ribon-helix-helix transcriptional regulator